MHTPQAGIFSMGDAAHGFFEFSLWPGSDPAKAAAALASIQLQRQTIGGANCVIGFRPSLWAKLSPGEVPAGITDFEKPLEGAAGYSMPATQADIWLWYSSAGYDTIFDLGTAAVRALGRFAKLEREQRGWVYHGNRDLTGFQDGTKNPTLDVVPEIVAVPEGQPGAGGSVLLFQVWLHQQNEFANLPQAKQEAVIGRTKPDSVEFDEAHMPADSHVSRTTIQIDGEERKIFRRNVAYGNVSEHGTLFIGFSCEQRRLQLMLEQMAGINGPRDALTNFTTPLTGAYYFIPSVQALRSLYPPDEDDD